MKRNSFIFIMIGLVIVCGIFYFIVHFSSTNILSTEGYYISHNQIVKSLTTNKIKDKEDIKMNEINYEDEFYSNLNKLYVCNEDRTYIDKNFPIISKDGKTLFNISSDTKLTNNKFEEEDTYENLTITDGKIFNYNDLEQATFSDYIFLKLDNNLYINLYELKIKTNTYNESIPLNSILYINKHSIKYYYFNKKGVLKYNIIEGISFDDSVTMGENKYKYSDILISFNIIDNEKENIELTDFNEEEYIIEDNKNIKSNTESGASNSKFIKPTVKTTNFKVNVYSAKSNIQISDPSKAIIGGVYYKFLINDKVMLNKGFKSSGDISIVGLKPSTSYTIIGYFKYYNEEKKKMVSEFFEQKVTTKGIDTLDTIDLSYENGDIYYNKINVKNIKINSDLESEALVGLKKLNVYIGDEVYSLSSSYIYSLTKGDSVEYTSPTKLNSNTTYNYYFDLEDSYGNKLVCNQSNRTTRTSLMDPTVTGKIVESNIKYLKYKFNLTNPDNVNITNFKYYIYDKNMNLIETKDLDSSLEEQTITINDLDPNSLYYIKVYGDYNLQNGLGVLEDNLMIDNKFTTIPLSSLGYFRFNNNVSNITNSSFDLGSSIDLDLTNSYLVDLWYSLKISIELDDEEIDCYNYNQEELQSLKTGEEFINSFSNLDSYTSYDIIYTIKVKQGNTIETIKVIYPVTSVKTYRVDARISIINKFVTENLIDFDVKINDPEDAIQSGRVLLTVRNSNGDLLDSQELTPNDDYKRLTYNKLDKDSRYIFTYLIEEYNIGYDNSTFQADFVMFSESIITNSGLSGTVEVDSLLRQITSNNLFDMSDTTRIKTTGYTGSKKYNYSDKTITFTAKNGYVNFAYYLPEQNSKSVTISFEARYASNTKNKVDAYVANGYTNLQNASYKLTDLSDSYKKYSFTMTMSTDYVGFNIAETAGQNKSTSVQFKNIQIISNDKSGAALNDVSYSYHSSGYKFSNSVMVAGNKSMPSYDGKSSMIGNVGNGYALITNLSDYTDYEFSYTGSYQEFTVPETSTYSISLWGASGGNNLLQNKKGSSGGKGAYTYGEIDLEKGTKLYIYVGQVGYDAVYRKGADSSFNGGGSADWDHSDDEADGGGGGATDIRLTNGNWDDEDSLKSRIMVAAGGGGGSDNVDGGPAGALSSLTTCSSVGATQISGYKFGIGQNGVLKRGNYPVAGGGGGYFGGTAIDNGSNYKNAASGGSSYISGYKGCVAYHKISKLPNIEISDDYEEYSEKDKYNGTVVVNMVDQNEQITNMKYYIRIYKDNDLLKTYEYKMNGNHFVKSATHNYEFDKNKNYTIKLSVYQNERYYDIDSIEFNTEKELRTIKTIDDFYSMHTNGRYLVANDLDFTSINRAYSDYFYGEVDFQGHKMIFNVQGHNSYMFHTLMGSAVIKNIEIDATLDNTSARSSFYGLFYRNYGTIENIYIKLYGESNQANYIFTIGGYINYGTINKFVLDSSNGVMSCRAYAGILLFYNQGLVKNGYAFGNNINGYSEAINVHKESGPIISQESTNSRLENVYSLMSVDYDNQNEDEREYSGANLVGYAGSGRITNAYSVDPEINTKLTTKDPNIGRGSGTTNKNLFYISDITYTGSSVRSAKTSALSLSDTHFQNRVLNTDDAFEVDKYVELGYYPQIDWDDCMPTQKWIALPSVEDSDLVDVTSAEEVTNEGTSATIKVYLHNPSAETITNIGIKDIGTVEILSQSNEDGKSELLIKVSNPVSYVSRYYIRAIEVTGALGYKYYRKYNDGERFIDFSLYRPIKTLDDWKLMNTYPTQNFMLYNDLDFKGVTINNYVITKVFTGILHGNGYSVKNIKFDTTSYHGMFSDFRGTMKNLNIVKFNKTSLTSFGGFVYRSYGSGTTFENVHMEDVHITAATYFGGILAYTDYMMNFTNCSVDGFTVTTNENYGDIRIGALFGYASYTNILNCYVQNIDIDATNVFTTYGVGGLAGQMNYGYIQDSYAVGKIQNSSSFTGGLVGRGSCIISRVWAKVDIYSEQDYVGEIIGNRDNDNVSNTLAIGNVLTTYDAYFFGRTAGNSLTAVQDNYSWINQKVNGYITSESETETLLTTDNLSSSNTYEEIIKLGGQFDYSKVEKNILPKVKDYYTGEVLEGQDDCKLVDDDIYIKNIVLDNAQSLIYMVINNPNEINITGLKFNYLKISKVTKLQTVDGETIIEVSVTPEKYLDYYILTQFTYNDGEGADKSLDTYSRIDLRYFKELRSITDWQSIDSSIPQNYRISGDIDFDGYSSFKYGIKVNRLDAVVADDGNPIYSIKNVTLSGNFADTGLIKYVSTSISGINFENINLTTTSSSSYFGIVRMCVGDITNCSFKDITITGTKFSNYLGIVSVYRGQTIKNISLDTVTINGNGNYVGGFVGAFNFVADVTNVTANHINVIGSLTYIGGIIGYIPYTATSRILHITADDIHVTGKTDVGCITGYGGCSYVTLTNSSVTGISGGSYLGAVCGRNSHRYGEYIEARNCSVYTPNSTNVGGLFGWAYDIYHTYGYNITVQNDSTSATSTTGGFIGYHSSYSLQDNSLVDSTVTSAGGRTGGFAGSTNSDSIYYSHVTDVKVIGTNYTGGFVGYTTIGRFYYNMAHAEVYATGNYTGGFVGYINDVSDESTSFSTIIYDNFVANCSIQSGGDYVGGFTGYSKDLQMVDVYFYYNFILANINTTGTGTHVDVINGSCYEEELPRFYLHENTSINGVIAKNMTDIKSVNATNIVTTTNMKDKTFYNGKLHTNYFDLTNVSNGYFPKIRYKSNGVLVLNQRDLALPTDENPISYSLKFATTSTNHKLPTFDLYSSGINTINVEFSDIDQGSYFKIYSNDKLKYESTINDRVYSFNYNYKDDIKIEVSDERNNTIKEYTKDDFINKVSVYKNKYAYIYKDKLNINNIDDKIIHLYKNYALTEDLKVYDFINNKYISNYDNIEFKLLNEKIPLYEFEYNDMKIYTYYNYSYIDNMDGVYYDKLLFVKDDNIEIIDSELDFNRNSIIIDSYNDNDYESILGNNNIIYNLKNELNLPSSILNKNIKYMSNNINNESNIIVLMYDSGKVVVYNYMTNEIIEEKKATEDILITEYFKKELTSNKSLLPEDKDSLYNETIDLEKLLKENPIIEEEEGEYVINKSNKKSKVNYITYYNVKDNTYNVVNFNEIASNKKVVDENDKIYTSDKLIDFYKVSSRDKTNFKSIDLIYLLGLILFGIIVSLILWVRNNRLLKKGNGDLT